MATSHALTRSRALSIVPLLLAAACGGNEPAPVAPTAPTASAAPAAAPPADVSAVADPRGLVLSGRLAKPSAVLATAHTWTNLPMPGAEQFAEMLTDEAVGAVIDLDQPVDFALAVEGTGMGMKELEAISAAVKDPDKVKAAFAERYKMTPGDGGATIVGGLGRKSQAGGGDDDDSDGDGKPDTPKSASGDDEDGRTCELAPAFGSAPVRLICAMNKKGLAELGPWLARTATRTTATSDLHADLRMLPLQSTLKGAKPLIGSILGSFMRSGPGGQALTDITVQAGSDVADLAIDLDGATLDATLGDTGIQTNLALHLTGSTSTIGRLLTGHPEKDAAPQPVFWQLPADADTAFFSHGSDDALSQKVRDTLVDAVGAGLTSLGAKTADAKAMQSALAKFSLGSSAAYATGIDAAAVRAAVAASKALGSDGPPAKKQEARRAAAEAMLGWRVLEIDQAPATVSGAIKDLMSALGRPSLAASLKAQDKYARMPQVRTAAVTKANALPAGSLGWMVELPAAPVLTSLDGKKKPGATAAPLGARLHVFVVPDGQRTWIGIGEEAIVAAKLAASMAAGGSQLSSRSDLATLKDGKVAMGGFLDARMLAAAPIQQRILAGGGARGAGALFDDADRLPNKGTSPVVITMTPQAGSPGSTLVLGVNVPRGAVEDGVTEYVRHAPTTESDE